MHNHSIRRRLWLNCWATAGALLITGCGRVPDDPPASQPSTARRRAAKPAVRSPPARAKQRETAPGARRVSASGRRSAPLKPLGLDANEAVGQVARAVTASLDLGPTLVVWVIDRSRSATPLRRQVLPSLQDWYVRRSGSKNRSANESPLETAIVPFGSEVEFALDPPSDDPDQINRTLEDLQVDTSGREVTFQAVRSALEKYLDYRTRRGYELVLAIVTDEAGDDAHLVDALLDTPRKYSIPIYCVGVPAPLGNGAALVAAVEAKEVPTRDDWQAIQQGPESRGRERLDLEFSGHLSLQLLDSGFGPFALERLCRATGGRFLALRPPPSDGPHFATPTTAWPRGDIPQFDSEVMRRYAPDDLSQSDYDTLVASNPAMSALRQAADMGRVACLSQPPLEFVKRSDAALNRSLEDAQKLAAKLLPRINRLYTLLLEGAGGRDTIERLRWQAAYDLAFGRAAAAKARTDGYNQMLAALKRGRLFRDPASTIWVLTPGPSVESSSALRNLIKKSRESLTRVTQQHANTPWAHIAQQELQLPAGWRWDER